MKLSMPHVVVKARKVFKENALTYTGIGLTRQELRRLENQGLVQKALSSTPGPRLYAWKPTGKLWVDREENP